MDGHGLAESSDPSFFFLPSACWHQCLLSKCGIAWQAVRLLSPGMLPDVVQPRVLDRAVCCWQALCAVLARANQLLVYLY